MPQVFVQKWEESERGWGQKPDGYSLHATQADVTAFVRAYWAKMPENPPSEYSRPCGTVYAANVTDEMLAKIKASKNGIRFHDNKYPGSGGTDGWRSVKLPAK